VAAGGLHGDWKESLEELAALADTAGARVVESVVQPHGRMNPATLVTRGKVDEIKAKAASASADIVLFDHDLTPAQLRNLEKATGRKIIDRSEIILDIFAARARTREARIQVELAQLQYMLPRLTRMWHHLSRLGGGIGTRGPGETQLEVDRRRVRQKIALLRQKLGDIQKERMVQRRRRRNVFRAALVGYTNAGKSTLFNVLTRADVFTENRLFATLDATTRQLVLPGRELVLLSDTVGFIRNLPHHLIASFRATLEEVTDADLLIHVADATSAYVMQHIAAVHTVLDDLGCMAKPRLLVFNKIDLMPADDIRLFGLRASHPRSIALSSHTRENLAALLARLGAARAEQAAASASRRGRDREDGWDRGGDRGDDSDDAGDDRGDRSDFRGGPGPVSA
jgi:GTP-binding protein HflX